MLWGGYSSKAHHRGNYICYIAGGTLCLKISDGIFNIFLIFPRKQGWAFHAICLWMKFESLFSEKNINLLFVELAHKIKTYTLADYYKVHGVAVSH